MKTIGYFIFIGIFYFFLLSISVLAYGQITHTIIVENNLFNPNTLDIFVGDTVKWVNQSGHHNVNGTLGTYASNPEGFGNSPATNWEYSYVFNTAGIYNYQCDPHAGLGMLGVLNVSEKLKVTISFSEMAPHVGQMLQLFIFSLDDQIYMDTITLDSVTDSNFEIASCNVKQGKSYSIDFYADHNNNGEYDAPPTDHAWRIVIEEINGDTTLAFAHNTLFTDIFNDGSTSIATNHLQEFDPVLYPNPSNNELFVGLNSNGQEGEIVLINLHGKTMLTEELNKYISNQRVDVSMLSPGVYFVIIKNSSLYFVDRIVIER